MIYQTCITFNSTCCLHFIYRDSGLLGSGDEIKLHDSQFKPHEGPNLVRRLLVTIGMKIHKNTVINMG